MTKKKTSADGFSLLEVMVSTSIIVVLSVVGMVSYSNVVRRSRDARRSSDLEQIRQALEIYRSDNGYYPAVNTSSLLPATSLGTNVLVPTYLPAIPKDPRNEATTPYVYRALNSSGSPVRYYGYCVAARLEGTTTVTNTCSIGIPTTPNAYQLGLGSP